jgi:hypothetical protein
MYTNALEAAPPCGPKTTLQGKLSLLQQCKLQSNALTMQTQNDNSEQQQTRQAMTARQMGGAFCNPKS